MGRTTLLDWGLAIVAVGQVIVVGLRVFARGRRLRLIINRGLPEGSEYADEDADGSSVQVTFGRTDAVPAEQSGSGGPDA